MFYKSVAWKSVTDFWDATDKVIAISAVIVFLLTLVNRKIAEWTVNTWSGISPWWSLVPIGGIVLYRLLRANYEAFAILNKQVTDRESLLSIQTELGDRLREVHELQQRQISSQDKLELFSHDISGWVIRTQRSLDKFGLAAESALFSTSDSGSPLYPETSNQFGPMPGLVEPRLGDWIGFYRHKIAPFERTLRDIVQRQSERVGG
jgi:hypothetical protein